MVRVRAVRCVRVGVRGVLVRAPVVISDPDAGEVWVWPAARCSVSAFGAFREVDGRKLEKFWDDEGLCVKAGIRSCPFCLAWRKHLDLAALAGVRPQERMPAEELPF